MKRRELLLTLCCLWPLAAAGAVPVPAPPQPAARAWILLDHHSGRVLAEHDADQPLEPASITKLMTAYLVFEALATGRLRLDEPVTISEKAWRNPEVPGWMDGSRMFVEVGSRVPVEDLLRGMIVQSGNDATLALAEHLAGSEAAFVEWMNRKAAELGLRASHFANSTGWPAPGHHMSARDIALLASALIRDFPQYYHYYSEKRYTYNDIPQANRNTLLWRDPSVDGLKTGHTESAGYCLAASAERDGMRLIAVVMGTAGPRERADAAQRLLDWGFRFYETHRLWAAGEAIRNEPVWGGRAETVPLGLTADLYLTVPRGHAEALKPLLELPERLWAPLEAGQVVGELRVELDGAVLATRPVVALEAVAEAGLLRRWWDRLRRWWSP